MSTPDPLQQRISVRADAAILPAGISLLAAPKFDAIRETFHSGRRRPRMINMTEDSSLEGGYNGGASENETSPSSESYDTSEESSDEKPAAANRKKSKINNRRRQLLRVKRIRSEIPDDIADYSEESNTMPMEDLTSSEDDTRSRIHTTSPAPDAAASQKKPQQQLLRVDGAVMAHILTYLDPPSILETLTMPLCKRWVSSYTRNAELWRVLCLLEPFKAQVDDDEEEEQEAKNCEEDSFGEIGGQDPLLSDRNYTKYRLTYTSFVKCTRYLIRITDDSRNGRPLTVVGFGNGGGGGQMIAANRNLQRFFSRARQSGNLEISEDDDETLSSVVLAQASAFPKMSRGKRSHHSHHRQRDGPAQKKPKYGHSKLTSSLLGPTASGVVGEVELPWSCAIFSIVNWMVGFSDVEGILTMCLKALPLLLEDEQQRVAAQGSGLTDIILRSMVNFPESASLHTAAFHTIVLLARPIGGREGMLFHSSMVNTDGIFNSSEVGSASGKSGIAVLLDSMRRFASDETLQAMGCWSLVNIALAPSQQNILIKLGAVDVALTAMVQHKDSPEVQFRALFALINLIIPPSSVGPQGDAEPSHPERQASAVSNSQESSTESDSSVDVDQIVELVVSCMKSYCNNESILNRACLVLHNLSLNPAFHFTMLWTPHCYLMLEWCLKNYPNDRVLQQGALNTLQRLQTTLSRNSDTRKKFRASLKAQRPQFRQQVVRSIAGPT